MSYLVRRNGSGGDVRFKNNDNRNFKSIAIQLVKPAFVIIFLVMTFGCANSANKPYSWINENKNPEDRLSDQRVCEQKSLKLAGDKPQREIEIEYRPSTGRGLTELGGRQRNRIALEEWESKYNSHYEGCMMDKGYLKVSD